MSPSSSPPPFFSTFTVMSPRIRVSCFSVILFAISYLNLFSLAALLCLTVIARFIVISATDVPALIKMLGPDLGKYKGKNGNIDKLIEEIEAKVAKLPSFG